MQPDKNYPPACTFMLLVAFQTPQPAVLQRVGPLLSVFVVDQRFELQESNIQRVDLPAIQLCDQRIERITPIREAR